LREQKASVFAPLWFDNQARLVILNAVIGLAFTVFASSHRLRRHISRRLRGLPGARFADRCGIFERRPELVANRVEVLGQKMVIKFTRLKNFKR
jgi:hypothetical protein